MDNKLHITYDWDSSLNNDTDTPNKETHINDSDFPEIDWSGWC